MLKEYKRDSKLYSLSEEGIRRKFYYTTKVVIELSSHTKLALVLKDMKQSIWWNHEAHFLVVNTNSDNGCQVPYGLLNILWVYNVLNAVYLCGDLNKQLFVYTLNPYANLAPIFWKSVQTGPESDSTFFKHDFDVEDERLYFKRKYIFIITHSI